jgi:hypothetical protein
MTNVLVAGASTTMAASHCLIEQGQMSPPVEPRHWSSESLFYAIACLGLLLCFYAGLYLLIGSGLLLF